MFVLFVYSDIGGAERYGARKYYSGLGSLSAVLKAAGHETGLLYLQEEMSREAFLSRLHRAIEGKRDRLGLAGFTATTNQYPHIARYAAYLK